MTIFDFPWIQAYKMWLMSGNSYFYSYYYSQFVNQIVNGKEDISFLSVWTTSGYKTLAVNGQVSLELDKKKVYHNIL